MYTVYKFHMGYIPIVKILIVLEALKEILILSLSTCEFTTAEALQGCWVYISSKHL